MHPLAELTGVVLQIKSWLLFYFVLLCAHSANTYPLRTQWDPSIVLNVLMIKRKQLETQVRVIKKASMELSLGRGISHGQKYGKQRKWEELTKLEERKRNNEQTDANSCKVCTVKGCRQPSEQKRWLILES